MILLDTCVLSELARGEPDEAVAAWWATVPEPTVRLSILTLGEIRKGAELLDPGPRRDRIECWLQDLIRIFGDRVLPIDQAVALRWGTLSAATRRAGIPRPPVDGLLAATALHHGLVLATRNVADFEGTGVSLINPWKFRPR